MGFKERSFEKPAYTESSEEPKKIIIISCEGCVTEPEYFKAVDEKLKGNISSLIKVEIVPKISTASEPADVLSNLEIFVDQYDFKKDHDSLWLVCDREKVVARKLNIEKILPECQEKGYSLAVANPLFEFWLLLHVVDIKKYDPDVLFCNSRVSKSRRYIDKELSNILKNGYNKKRGRFNKDIISLDNIKFAINQEKLFENELTGILERLGSNIGSLVREIIDDIPSD